MERRTFLSQSFLVSLGLTTSVSALPAGSSLSAVCEAKPSPADALDIYKPLLTELENEINQGLVDRLVSISKRCTDLLRDLRQKVVQLEAEVKSNKPQNQILTNLVDTGSKQQVTAVTSPDAAAAKAATQAVISQQVRANVQDHLLRTGDKLSPTAARLINEVVALIKESVGVEQDLVAEQSTLTVKLNALRGHFRSVNDLIVQATQSIDVATHSKSTADRIGDAKKQAQEKIGKAVDTIGQ